MLTHVPLGKYDFTKLLEEVSASKTGVIFKALAKIKECSVSLKVSSS
jgi:hypothetical protein